MTCHGCKLKTGNAADDDVLCVVFFSVESRHFIEPELSILYIKWHTQPLSTYAT
jgi:hypothetical protein